jgi:hypothetical protein
MSDNLGEKQSYTDEQTPRQQIEERQRREEVIRSLASQVDNPPNTESGTVTRTARAMRLYSRNHSWGIWVVAGMTLLLIAIVAVTVLPGYFSSHTRVSSNPPASIRLDLNSIGYSCPTAMAWSSDGFVLAVLAQKGKITSDQIGLPCASDTVLLFDTHRAILRAALPFAATLMHANASLSPTGYALSWAPDSKSLAVACVIATQNPAHPVDPCVLLIPVNGSQPDIIHGFVDLTRGEKSITFNTLSHTVASASAYPIPQALGYQLSPAGQVITNHPFANVTTDSPFTGSPHLGSDGSFSFWESGALIGISPPQHSSELVVYYTATLGIWSADGKYVNPSLTIGPAGFVDDKAAIDTMDPQACVVKGFASCARPPIPYADRALMLVKRKFAQEMGSQPYQASSPISWRPDGQILATVLPSDDFDDQRDFVQVTLLATSDGSVVKTLTTQTSSSQDSAPFADLNWSPTGDQLAFRDTYSATITVWNGLEANLPNSIHS